MGRIRKIGSDHCNYSQILYQFLTFTQNLKRSLFYIKNGFKTVGRFHNCGYKFNRWYDMIWMEKIIGDYTCAQPPIIPYPEVNFSEDFSLGI
jgi:hypothetical protein